MEGIHWPEMKKIQDGQKFQIEQHGSKFNACYYPQKYTVIAKEVKDWSCKNCDLHHWCIASACMRNFWNDEDPWATSFGDYHCNGLFGHYNERCEHHCVFKFYGRSKKWVRLNNKYDYKHREYQL